MKSAKKQIVIIIGAAAFLALTVTVCFLLFHKNQTDSNVKYDSNATTGIMPGIDLEQRKKELQDLLDENLIAFSINTNPVFLNGTEKGNLLIENPGNNAKLLKVSIVINDSKEEVYSSDYLKPGTYIESVRLDKVLEKGNYQATAYFNAYDETTEEYIGQTGAGISITIQN